MDGRPYFITVEEAHTITFQTPPSLSVDTIPIDACSNRVLAEDLPSQVNDPRLTIRPWTVLRVCSNPMPRTH